MTVLIRNATIDDAEAIAGVHLSSMRAAFEDQLPDHVAKSVIDISNLQQRTRGWTGWLKRTRASTVVARVDGTVIGFCALHALRDEESGKEVGEITCLYVLPSHWRRGIGRRLCERMLAEAQARDLSEVMLWVLESNERARRFYDSLDFRPDGTTRMFFECSETSLYELRYLRSTSIAEV